MNIEEIIEDIKNILSEARFKHSVGVMKRAEELARIYDVDIDTAKKVGIAHDIAKEMSKKESLEYTRGNNIEVDEIEKENTSLLHGKIGADIVKKKYGFTEQMQNAIKVHTTGSPDMDILAKILYIADKTEENRKEENENLEYEIKLSNSNIDKAIVYLINKSIKKNIDREKLIHPDSIYTRNKLL